MNKKLATIISIIFISVAYVYLAYSGLEHKTPVYGMFYQANELFKGKQYEQAIKQYEEILQQEVESGNLYYNLGNAYFKNGKLGKAIANYEKAKRFIPGDSDLKANISFAESLRENPVEEKQGIWLMRIIKQLGENATEDQITIITVFIYWLITILISLSILFKQVGFFLRKYMISGLIVLFFMVCIWGVKIYDMRANTSAVIIEKVADSKFAPAEEATTYFKLFEGTKVGIIRKEGSWVRIKTPDNKLGWVQAQYLEKI